MFILKIISEFLMSIYDRALRGQQQVEQQAAGEESTHIGVRRKGAGR